MSTRNSAAVYKNIILYGFDADKTSDVSKSLQEKGITLLRAAPFDIKVNCVRMEIQPGYDIYVRNLPKFIEANRTSKIVPFNPPFIALLTICKEPILKTLPPLTVTFEKALGDSEALLANTGYSKTEFRKVYQYTFPNPTSDLIKSIMPFRPNRLVQCPNGTVNLDALNRFTQACCLLDAVLKVQNYPAYEVSDVLEVDNTPVKRQIPIDTNSSNNTMTDNDESEQPTKRFAETRTCAKPSKTKQLVYKGSASDIPFNYGCIAKYVPDLAKADKSTVPAFLDKYLFTGFGSNMDASRDMSDGIRSAWGLLAHTSEGSILAHICKSVEICLEAQAKPYVIYSGDIYVGTAILGTKFHLSIGSRSFLPLLDNDFATLLQSVDAHTAALTRIGEIARFDVEVKSMRQLRKIIVVAKLTMAEADEIASLAINLSFPQPYWTFNHVNVTNCLSLLLDSNKEIEDDTPMHPAFIFTKDRIEEVLSAFGINAPTFYFSTSTKYLILEKPFSELKSISTRWVSTADAVIDCRRMISEGAISQPKTIPQSSNATIRTFSEKAKLEEIKKLLQDLIKAKGTNNSTVSTQEVQVPYSEESVDFY